MIVEDKQYEALLSEVATLRERVAELEQQEGGKFRALLELAPDAIVIINADGRIVLVNSRTEQLFGYERADLLNQPIEILVPERFRKRHVGHRSHYFANPHTRPMGVNVSLYAARKDGSEFPVEISLSPLETEEGLLVTSIIRDITERLRAEEALRHSKQQDEIIRSQEMALRELSTPLIPINDDVMIMPLIGAIDQRRAQQVLETILHGIAQTNAQMVILDITGVSIVDTQVANALVQAAQAVQLLGAQVVLTGIRPEVAQTLVGLAVDLKGIVTHGSLQSGIAYAIRRR